MRRTSAPALPAAALLIALATGALPAQAQLRPHAPVDWGRTAETRVRCGAGFYHDQTAALAGVVGNLTDAGDCELQFAREGATFRIVGVAYRWHEQRRVIAPPSIGIEPDADGTRAGFGDLVLEALIPLLDRRGPAVGLRAGMRVPSTDNQLGLERDQTDIYAAVALAGQLRHVEVFTENGVGIHGTRRQRHEQQDVWIYAAGVRGDVGPVRAHALVVGHRFWANDWTWRGNENLNELRFGARMGARRWLDAELVFGTAAVSPDWGLRLGAGITLDAHH